MDLVCQSQLRAARVVWMPGHGGFTFTVVCKATFALRPELSPLAPTQEAVTEADVLGDAGSLALATDLVPFKKRPEVLLTGHAFAPEGKRVPSFVVRLAAGEIDKSIHVVGNRGFGADGRLGEPAPFARMPLVWGRAAGGPNSINPAGRPIGQGAPPDAEGRIQAPNLLPVGLALASRGDFVPPVGFGPIAPSWPTRVACLHRHAHGWDPARWHERPLPADIDLAYFNAAPPDQQRAQPFGEETLHLENLHPLFGRLTTRLAPATPVVTVERDGARESLQLRCDTLIINTDRGLAMLVWRGHVPLDHPDRPGRVLVGDGGERISTAPGAARGAVSFDVTHAQEGLGQAGRAVPFAEAGIGGEATHVFGERPGEPEQALSAGAGESPLASGATVAVDALFGGTMAFGFANAAPVVPFVGGRGDSAPRPASPVVDSHAALPFAPPAPPAVPVSVGASVVEAPPPPAVVALRGPASEALSGFGVALGRPASERPSSGLALPPSPDSPAPPPLLGQEPASKGAESAPPPVAAEIDVEAFPPLRCGTIAARIACDPDAEADVLAAEGLDAAAWERVHETWQDRIDADLARSRIKLRGEYDSGYVSALEAHRGPMTLEDYAGVAESAERDAAEEALAQRGLPEGAWPHVHRVWIQRVSRDAKLGKQVNAAIRAARRGQGD